MAQVKTVDTQHDGSGDAKGTVSVPTNVVGLVGGFYINDDTGLAITVAAAGTPVVVKDTGVTPVLKAMTPLSGMTGAVTTGKLTMATDWGAGKAARISYRASLKGNDSALVKAFVYVNGTKRAESASRTKMPSTAVEQNAAGSFLLALSSTDTVEMRVDSGSNADVVTLLDLQLTVEAVDAQALS